MDLVAPVRVVIVDDKPTHLIAIANGLTLAGIPCVWHWYNPEDNTLVPSPPVGGYPHLRMLFTDLNIREMVGANKEAKTLAGVLMSEVLQPIVSQSGGPYSVVLWTNVEGAANDVGEIISSRIDADGIDVEERRPQPLAITVLPKREFIAGYGTDVDKHVARLLVESAQSAARLKELVVGATSANAQLRLACAWESRASMAAMETVNAVYDAAIEDGRTTNRSPTESLQKIFSKIAIDALGAKNAKDDPSRALDEGLIDIFVDDMRSSEVDTDYEAVLHTALDDVLNIAPPKVSLLARSRLNTFLQIEYPPRVSSRIARGSVLSMAGVEFEKFTGIKAKKLLWDEFLTPTNILCEELNGLRDAGKTDELIQQRYDFCVANKQRVEDESKVMILEIGADCDHAQRKQRTIRFLCVAEVPLELANFVYPSYAPEKLKHDALLLLGPWSINSRDVILVASVKRFAIQQVWERAVHMDVRYRLRRPLVDLLLHKYSTHSTRPGIISISE